MTSPHDARFKRRVAELLRNTAPRRTHQRAHPASIVIGRDLVLHQPTFHITTACTAAPGSAEEGPAGDDQAGPAGPFNQGLRLLNQPRKCIKSAASIWRNGAKRPELHQINRNRRRAAKPASQNGFSRFFKPLHGFQNCLNSAAPSQPAARRAAR